MIERGHQVQRMPPIHAALQAAFDLGCGKVGMVALDDRTNTAAECVQAGCSIVAFSGLLLIVQPPSVY